MTRGKSSTAAAGEPCVIHVPGDKSITHRALMFASLATGDSRIVRPLDAADTRSTAEALRALGCDIAGGESPRRSARTSAGDGPGSLGEAIVVRGRGLRGWVEPADALDCGNSGTTARLMMGALAAISGPWPRPLPLPPLPGVPGGGWSRAEPAAAARA